MTDRELLELAAKASGFGGPEHKFCWTESEYPRGSDQHGALWNYIGHMDTAVLWNPLTDDGDRYRLAKKLDIRIHFGPAYVTYEAAGVCGVVRWPEDEPNDARAIVRAAAEIGRATKETA